jgi:3-hydroxyisobutyrate dehydrogenase-like beta-hydroxyacid dehydrogenase
MTYVPQTIALIGFGEVGQVLAKDFRAAGVREIRAFDTAFADSASAPAKAAKAAKVVAARSSGEAIRRQTIIISAVTAGSAEAVAQTAAASIEPGAFYVDVNSVSPGTKVSIGEIVGAQGARFVEVAVMSPINPRGIRSPMLVGGRHAPDFIEEIRAFEPDMIAIEGPVGRAAATKMCRSVMYKGIEALFLESMISARHYGIEGEVLASLKDTFERGWPETARYMISRTLLHGRRRAEEMREAAKTVKEAGLGPLLTAGTAERQDWAADQATHLVGIVPTEAPLESLLDALLNGIGAAASK